MVMVNQSTNDVHSIRSEFSQNVWRFRSEVDDVLLSKSRLWAVRSPMDLFNRWNQISINLQSCLSSLRAQLHGFALKTLDTFGNCRRPVLSLGVSQYMHKITNLWTFELNWPSKLQDNYERKNTLVTRGRLCAFRCLILAPQNLSDVLSDFVMLTIILSNYQ